MRSQISETEIMTTYKNVFMAVEDIEDILLKKGVYFALLGAIYAFHDRELNPLENQHYQLFKVIKNDILKVYEEISNSLVDEETWFFETFDYGIKHVYYLDWQLYLSKICY